jgi:hypothetical protein
MCGKCYFVIYSGILKVELGVGCEERGDRADESNARPSHEGGVGYDRKIVHKRGFRVS